MLGASNLIGVLGYAPAGGFAGYFAGNLNVTGTLTKGAGAFRIDTRSTRRTSICSTRSSSRRR